MLRPGPLQTLGKTERTVSLQSPESRDCAFLQEQLLPLVPSKPSPEPGRHTQHIPSRGTSREGHITGLTFPRGELMHNLCTEQAQALIPKPFPGQFRPCFNPRVILLLCKKPGGLGRNHSLQGKNGDSAQIPPSELSWQEFQAGH